MGLCNRMPLQKSNLNGLYPNLPYKKVLFDGGSHLILLQGHEMSFDGLLGVFKGFIDRLLESSNPEAQELRTSSPLLPPGVSKSYIP